MTRARVLSILALPLAVVAALPWLATPAKAWGPYDPYGHPYWHRPRVIVGPPVVYAPRPGIWIRPHWYRGVFIPGHWR